MKISYYPGCTLSTKAKSLDKSARAAASSLGIELVELPNWTCCGASFPLVDDNLIGMVAATRILANAKKEVWVDPNLDASHRDSGVDQNFSPQSAPAFELKGGEKFCPNLDAFVLRTKTSVPAEPTASHRESTAVEDSRENVNGGV